MRLTAEHESRLADIRAAPQDAGTLELIVIRPAPGERVTPSHADLDLIQGVVGDRWYSECGHLDDPDELACQVTLTSARAAALYAGERARWPLAGDQMCVDLDLSYANLPPGTRLAVGDAVIEVTHVPHTGCGKFVRRFGVPMMKLVNSAAGRELNLRGINARVITPGTVRVGDRLTKLPD